MKQKQVTVSKDKEVHVQCSVKGDNPIEIKWKIQNTQQHLDESMDARWESLKSFNFTLNLIFRVFRYTIREQILDDGMISELTISHSYRQDTGMYICQANNAFGQV